MTIETNIEEILASFSKEEKSALLVSVLIPMIEILIRDGKLDKNRLDDEKYVKSIVGKNKHLIDDLRFVTVIDDDFMKSAREAVNHDRVSVAIVLVAVSLEHKLNLFYRRILQIHAGLEDKETTEAIRSSFHIKLGWLMSLSTGSTVPDDLKKQMMETIELRNAFVHYKANSYLIDQSDQDKYAILVGKAKLLGMENILELPIKLEAYLNELEYELLPSYRLAWDTLRTLSNS